MITSGSDVFSLGPSAYTYRMARGYTRRVSSYVTEFKVTLLRWPQREWWIIISLDPVMHSLYKCTYDDRMNTGRCSEG